MSSTLPIKVIGPCLALGAFSTSMIVGMAANNPTDVVLSRALVAMAGAYAVGSLIGVVVGKIVAAELARRTTTESALAKVPNVDSISPSTTREVITNAPTT